MDADTKLGKDIGDRLRRIRLERQVTQRQLEEKCGIDQSRISRIEIGQEIPTLPQILALARALVVPLQFFLSGSFEPNAEMKDLALELSHLGIVDLLTGEPTVPGSFRPLEQIVSLVVAGDQPNPRLIEAIPAVLSWNRWIPALLDVYARSTDNRAGRRLAWLADIALTIHHTTGFPGGCRALRKLENYKKRWKKRLSTNTHNDDLGRPVTDATSLHPLWKRWRIVYDAKLTDFENRSRHLLNLSRVKHV